MLNPSQDPFDVLSLPSVFLEMNIMGCLSQITDVHFERGRLSSLTQEEVASVNFRQEGQQEAILRHRGFLLAICRTTQCLQVQILPVSNPALCS